MGEKSTGHGEDDEHVAKWSVGGGDDGDGERKNDWVGNMKMSLQNGALARFGLGTPARTVTCYITSASFQNCVVPTKISLASLRRSQHHYYTTGHREMKLEVRAS